MTPEQFIAAIAPSAVAFMCKTRISAALVIGQGGLESGWGKTAAAMHNNIFGIKADPTWTGPKFSAQTQEFINGQRVTVTAEFRAYPSVSACLEDHDAFLRQPRYANLVGADYKTACHLIAAVDHYATDPNYETQLLDIIQQYDLTQYDKEASTVTYPAVKAFFDGKQYLAIDVNGDTYFVWTLARDAGLNLTKVAYGDVEIAGVKPTQVKYNGNTYLRYSEVKGLQPERLPDNSGWNFVKVTPEPATPTSTTTPSSLPQLLCVLDGSQLSDGTTFLFFLPVDHPNMQAIGPVTLDTGASELVIDEDLANSLGCPRGRPAYAGAPGGGQLVGYYSEIPVRIGDRTINMECQVFPNFGTPTGSLGLFGYKGLYDNALAVLVNPITKKASIYDAKEVQ